MVPEEKNQPVELIEILAIIISLTSVVIFVFYLFLAYNQCIIFTEPIALIRWSEVIMGGVAILVLINLLRKKIMSFYRS